MSHDHVGIPKFIEKGFSDKEKVYVYNLMSDKVYQEKKLTCLFICDRV